ncbi:uncharacterized protein B0I36DRAFT_358566 [Microdochium trichocladiopsis]|uniref:BTB domain-containing protein n=1 Tax=Microdochium trichocladiopsis TaxID=1682393 RepID=A0A9P8YK24_9PEZI|nr:uncharacterized protein B0I36DRAFT_358566 [Microdochium trichocladiopsis]KAH7041392.1 hypothetical protein B0I36DRAFT_358566 [Microdochium trichocladiopsis]
MAEPHPPKPAVSVVKDKAPDLPFAKLVKLRFKHDAILTVHAFILQLKHFPKPQNQANDPLDVIDFSYTSAEAGHVLSHYLYSRTCDFPVPLGNCKTVADYLSTALELHILATQYKLEALLNSVKARVIEFTNKMQHKEVFKTIHDCYTNADPGLDTKSYLRDILKLYLDKQHGLWNSAVWDIVDQIGVHDDASRRAIPIKETVLSILLELALEKKATEVQELRRVIAEKDATIGELEDKKPSAFLAKPTQPLFGSASFGSPQSTFGIAAQSSRFGAQNASFGASPGTPRPQGSAFGAPNVTKAKGAPLGMPETSPSDLPNISQSPVMAPSTTDSSIMTQLDTPGSELTERAEQTIICNRSARYDTTLSMAFKDGKILQAHSFILSKLTGLPCDVEGDQPLPMPVHLNISSQAGHILVHYLYSGDLDLDSLPEDNGFAALASRLAQQADASTLPATPAANSIDAAKLVVLFELAAKSTEIHDLELFDLVIFPMYGLIFSHLGFVAVLECMRRAFACGIDDVSAGEWIQRLARELVSDFRNDFAHQWDEVRAFSRSLISSTPLLGTNKSSSVVDTMILKALLEAEMDATDARSRAASQPERVTLATSSEAEAFICSSCAAALDVINGRGPAQLDDKVSQLRSIVAEARGILSRAYRVPIGVRKAPWVADKSRLQEITYLLEEFIFDVDSPAGAKASIALHSK